MRSLGWGAGGGGGGEEGEVEKGEVGVVGGEKRAILVAGRVMGFSGLFVGFSGLFEVGLSGFFPARVGVVGLGVVVGLAGGLEGFRPCGRAREGEGKTEGEAEAEMVEEAVKGGEIGELVEKEERGEMVEAETADMGRTERLLRGGRGGEGGGDLEAGEGDIAAGEGRGRRLEIREQREGWLLELAREWAFSPFW